MKRFEIHLLLSIIISLSFIFFGCDTDSDYPAWTTESKTLFGHLPHWSPDGSSILFADDSPLNGGLWLLSQDGSVNRIIDSLHSHNWDYGWSPDGSMIAFSAPGEPGSENAGIWLYDIAEDTLLHILDRGRDVSWYYDAMSIIIRIDHPETGIPGIYRLSIVNSELEFITEGYIPKASPSEPWIAYNESEINGRLFVIDEHYRSVEVTELGAQLYTWSADGRVLTSIVNYYVSGIINGKLFRIERSDSTWIPEEIVPDKASYPAPNRNGTIIAYMAMDDSDGWEGIKLWGTADNRLVITTMGFNPEFNPVDGSLIAIDTPENGIQLLVQGM
jgi:dipeptidyl aminopeptidase/acylaminoacyl peptidase